MSIAVEKKRILTANELRGQTLPPNDGSGKLRLPFGLSGVNA